MTVHASFSLDLSEKQAREAVVVDFITSCDEVKMSCREDREVIGANLCGRKLFFESRGNKNVHVQFSCEVDEAQSGT